MYKNTFSRKQEGFIYRSKVSKGAQFSDRSHSHDVVLTNHSTLNTQFEKSPGEIKKMNHSNMQVEKIDEEVHYNSDIYLKYEKMNRPAVKYQECQDVAIQVRKEQPRVESPNKKTMKRTEQSRFDSKKQILLPNIHGSFELHKYQQLYHLLKNIILAFQINEIEVLKSIRPYLSFATKENVDNVSQLKFIPNKRELIKQSYAIEREAMIVLCFVIATNRFQALKNYCSNLLKYALDNYLLALNLLTQDNNDYVEHLLEQNHREHLKGKGFDLIRSNNETMTTLIVKVSKNDPLFAGQFCKIIENYSDHSVKAELYSLITFFAFYLHATKTDHIIPFLSAAPGPYVIDQPQLQYTLVIDFVKIFIDSSVPIRKQLKKDHLLIRPYSQYFLNEMSKYFEVISFSDYLPIECNKIINKIDQKRNVKHRLYKYHIDESRKKDIDKIGRCSDRLILLDNTQSLKPDNQLLIHSWKGESSDAILAEICPLLVMIPVKKLSVLSSLQKIKEGMTKNANLGLKYINCGLGLQPLS